MKLFLSTLILLSSALGVAQVLEVKTDIRAEINAIQPERANEVYNLINQKVRTCDDIRAAVDGIIDQRKKLGDDQSAAGRIYVTYQDRLSSAYLGMNCGKDFDTGSRFEKTR